MENKKISFKHICKEDTYMFNYTQLPDELFTMEVFMTLSLHAKVLYSFMLRRISISKENSWIDEAGDVYIYYRAEEVMEKFNCSNKTAVKIMAELEDIGLIEKKRQGQGNPAIIYVNKFSTAIPKDNEEEPELPIDHMEHLYIEENTENEAATEEKSEQNSEVKNLHFKKCKNYTSRNVKNTPLEVKNLHTSYKENNYKDIVSSSSTDPPEPDSVREQIRLLEEDKEEQLRKKIRYEDAERLYSVQIAKPALNELFKRDEEYRHRFTADMFAKVCKTIAASKEPIIHLSGFINWCFDNISLLPTTNDLKNQFNQFMSRDYDFEALERDILSN